MGTFFDQKRQARLHLHQELSQPVIYIPMKAGTPTGATARLHLIHDELGELRRSGFAERAELTPKMVFLVSECYPARGSLVVTQSMGAFLVEQTDAPHDITVKASISRLPVSQYPAWGLATGLPWLGLTYPEV